jgi:hypothetical protein
MKCPNCGVEFPVQEQAELSWGPIAIADPEKFPKKKLDNETENSVKSQFNSIDHSFNDVEDIINSIQLIIGPYEMALNEPLWRKYAQEDRDALRFAVFKWDGLNLIKKRSVKHPPSWLNAMYKRGHIVLGIQRKSG